VGGGAANTKVFFIYYFNDFSEWWHVASIYHCPHVGSTLCGVLVPRTMQNIPKSAYAFPSPLTICPILLFFLIPPFLEVDLLYSSKGVDGAL